MSGSGTGTLATAPHQVTADDLIDDAIRPALDDAGASVFTDAELLSFLNESIREYSQHLPRISTASLATISNTRSYSLPYDLINVLAVEYPTDEEPPSFLTRLGRKRRDFLTSTFSYDFLPRLDLTNAPTLLLSFDPDAAETITVTYQHPHDHELTADSYITVPTEHHHVLIQYVLFACSRQLQANEEAAPTSSSSLLMSQYASNTRRYELAYLNALNRILFQRRGQSDTTAWQMDRWDRIY